MQRIPAFLSVLALALAASGCASWDSMNSRQKSAVVGAGVGGVVGAAVTGGGVLGTVGGAAIGGVIGDQVGKQRR
ncbi:MAG: glycine zipper 2TM domain-containing protein [Azonexus sp.]|jgi:osmotically inducible lipoprotein OsmB|nr:glycine zipper 2TM domain-containing protein [Betaproteobacteria bacterium]MBK8916793.1 glycine zipper 2TM domain-containing protein [Betaproteobacteria bacterium]MBP6036628.1 glycine zipper 2TM domain-containing protein [Azonexus sp.]MBP6907237.1 glycine zipper 2TM domain-containing protein [Azonexus sp.]